MIMHRIKQMHDKNNSGVKMTTYTSQNLEAFRRTMHIDTYFTAQKQSQSEFDKSFVDEDHQTPLKDAKHQTIEDNSGQKGADHKEQ
jgi:arginine deiminase